MDTDHSELLSGASGLFDDLLTALLSLYNYDLEMMHHWYVIFWFPLYILKWVYIFLPIFILLGGIYGVRSGSRQNKTGQK